MSGHTGTPWGELGEAWLRLLQEMVVPAREWSQSVGPLTVFLVTAGGMGASSSNLQKGPFSREQDGYVLRASWVPCVFPCSLLGPHTAPS